MCIIGSVLACKLCMQCLMTQYLKVKTNNIFSSDNPYVRVLFLNYFIQSVRNLLGGPAIDHRYDRDDYCDFL